MIFSYIYVVFVVCPVVQYMIYAVVIKKSGAEKISYKMIYENCQTFKNACVANNEI